MEHDSNGRGTPKAARMRAGVALLIGVPAPTLAVLTAMWWWPGTRLATAAYFLSKAWQIVLPVAWRVGVERRPISFSPPRRGGFVPGVALGLVIAAIILGGYLLLGHHVIHDPQVFRDEAARNGLDNPRRYLALAGFLILANALMEEYFWRWFIFRQFETLFGGTRRGVGITTLAVIAAALAFTLHHIFALAAQFGWLMTTLAAVGVCIGGLVWSGLYARYRSVWPGCVSHAIVDTSIFVVGWWLLFG